MNTKKMDIIKLIWNRIQPQYWITLVSGLVIGMFTHFFMLTNKMPNWDDVFNYDSCGSQGYLGRWFLGYVHKIGGKVNTPAVHGVLAILAISLASCVVVRILELKTTTSCILTASVMVTFPAVACTMPFMFTVHAYAIGILMNSLAVYCFRRWKWGYIPGGVLVICSLGIYQSYVSITIALILMSMIVDIIREKKCTHVIMNGVLSAVTLGVCVPIYKKICCIAYPDFLNCEYGGVGNMGEIAVSDMPILVGRAYKRFLEYFVFKPFDFVTPWMQRTNIAVCILAIIIFVVIVVTRKMWKEPLRLVVLTVSSIFVPLAVAFVYFMAPDVDYSMLMLYAYSLIYVLVIALAENTIGSRENEPYIRRNVPYLVLYLLVIVCIFINCYSNYLLSNKAYYRSYIAFERAKSYYNRILDKIELTDGYRYGDKVLLVGEFNYEDNPAPIEIDVFNSEGLRSMQSIALENGLITSGVRKEFIELYIGFPVGVVSDEERMTILASDQLERMPEYPTAGCIKMINNIWVVKLTDELGIED